jgi:hypothetical protein
MKLVLNSAWGGGIALTLRIRRQYRSSINVVLNWKA